MKILKLTGRDDSPVYVSRDKINYYKNGSPGTMIYIDGVKIGVQEPLEIFNRILFHFEDNDETQIASRKSVELL